MYKTPIELQEADKQPMYFNTSIYSKQDQINAMHNVLRGAKNKAFNNIDRDRNSGIHKANTHKLIGLQLVRKFNGIAKNITDDHVRRVFNNFTIKEKPKKKKKTFFCAKWFDGMHYLNKTEIMEKNKNNKQFKKTYNEFSKIKYKPTKPELKLNERYEPYMTKNFFIPDSQHMKLRKMNDINVKKMFKKNKKESELIDINLKNKQTIKSNDSLKSLLEDYTNKNDEIDRAEKRFKMRMKNKNNKQKEYKNKLLIKQTKLSNLSVSDGNFDYKKNQENKSDSLYKKYLNTSSSKDFSSDTAADSNDKIKQISSNRENDPIKVEVYEDKEETENIKKDIKKSILKNFRKTKNAINGIIGKNLNKHFVKMVIDMDDYNPNKQLFNQKKYKKVNTKRYYRPALANKNKKIFITALEKGKYQFNKIPKKIKKSIANDIRKDYLLRGGKDVSYLS